MKIFLKYLLTIFFLFIAAIFISGCINVIQKVKLNEDGSGIMNIRYWAEYDKEAKDVEGFSFTAERIKKNYTSPNSEPTDIKIENDITPDHLSVVTLNLKFKDFNKLSSAIAFERIKSSFAYSVSEKEFKYVVLKDTSVTKDMRYYKYKIYHEFEFPSEVIYTNGNVNTKNNLVCWSNTYADLLNDIEMLATIK